jgi:hypothetical protein
LVHRDFLPLLLFREAGFVVPAACEVAEFSFQLEIVPPMSGIKRAVLEGRLDGASGFTAVFAVPNWVTINLLAVTKPPRREERVEMLLTSGSEDDRGFTHPVNRSPWLR